MSIFPRNKKRRTPNRYKFSKRPISKLVQSLATDSKIYGIKRKDEIGELARTISSMREDIDTSEINIHVMMMERERQEYLMRTIDNVAFALLAIAVEDEKQFDHALQEGLTEVAQCVDVDGIYVWRNATVDNEYQFVLKTNWTNSIEKESRTEPMREWYSYNDTPGWYKRFSDGFPLNATRSQLSAQEQAILGPHAQSVLILPMHLQDHFWGIVFFEDCKRKRVFTTDEMSLLQSASFMIVSALRRKKQAARINEVNTRVKLMLDATPIGCFLWNNKLEAFDCNPATLSLFNIDDREEMLVRIKNLAPQCQANGKCSKQLFGEHLTRAFEEGRDDFEWICSTSDGTLFPAEVNFRRVRYGDQFVVAGYMRDMREQKRLIHEIEERGQQLEHALAEVQAASQSKTNFLSNTSHEMRTPMNAIIGMAMIGKNAGNVPAKDDAFEKIESASSHLLGVINDILDMSKIEAGKLDLYEEPFSLEKNLQTVLNIILFRIEEKGQKLHMDIGKDVPPVIVTDAQRLTQVLTNLLSNAIKFTPDGKEIRLTVEVLNQDQKYCSLKFSIIDEGIGISEEQQSRIFTPFEQAEASTTREFGGTGLGLTISKHIVDLMNGKIWIESELGCGATFSFIINVEYQKNTEETTFIDDVHYEEETYPGKCVLLAEDIDINREIFLTVLEPTELEVVCAENGEEAVRAFKENPEKFNLIFMDVQMPVIDGHEATRQIRALDIPYAKDVPIVAMTANVFRDDIEKCLESGMNAHLGKPLDFDAVDAVLRKYLT
ncbi:MAG: ATP-binding protein [Defluviitaleaceae bacterium]|nr:ATP-binding protein [Defluviitaleaceae bacterium]